MFPRFKYLNGLRFIDEPDADTGTAGEGDSDATEEQPAKTAEELAESVRKLEASLKAEREAHKVTKASTKRVAELEAAVEAAKAEKMTEAEKAIAEARKEAEAEVSARYADRLVSERVRSLASAKFTEPSDVLMFLRSSDSNYEFEIDDDLEIDNEAINKALDEVAKARPHWLKSGTASARDAGIGSTDNSKPKVIDNLTDAITARYASKR
jgi:multidrug efflux pump subunit AcrA (membrane-fusion protein)